MKLFAIFTIAACSAGLWSSAFAQEQWPLHDNELNKLVQWYAACRLLLMHANKVTRDHYSYIIQGQRLVVWSGEVCSNNVFYHVMALTTLQFHPWRIPVPELWIDIIEKIKSAG